MLALVATGTNHAHDKSRSTGINWKDTSGRYGSVSIGLHWLTLALLIGVYACINLTDLYAKGSPPREALKD